MEGFLFSKNDIKNEKVDQKDCLSVLTWSGKGIKLDKRALDMKKVDATNFELWCWENILSMVAIQNACGKQMKKPVIECRMFSQVNAKLLDYILSKVDPETMEENLSNVEIDKRWWVMLKKLEEMMKWIQATIDYFNVISK